MSYISSSDITDKIADGFDVTPYILESDQALEDLSETVGVDAGDIDQSPLHFQVRRYAIVYALMRLCQDKGGGVSADIPEANKYDVRYEMYRRELDHITKRITPQMLNGNVSTISDRVSSVEVWRG